MRRLASSQLDRGDEPVDDELEAEVEDGDDDEPCHDRHLQVNARLKLVDLVVMDAALLGFEEIASFVRILQHDDHEDEVEGVQEDRDEEFHALDID